MGTGSDPTRANPRESALGEVPVPIFSQPLRFAAGAENGQDTASACPCVARRKQKKGHPPGWPLEPVRFFNGLLAATHAARRRQNLIPNQVTAPNSDQTTIVAGSGVDPSNGLAEVMYNCGWPSDSSSQYGASGG